MYSLECVCGRHYGARCACFKTMNCRSASTTPSFEECLAFYTITQIWLSDFAQRIADSACHPRRHGQIHALGDSHDEFQTSFDFSPEQYKRCDESRSRDAICRKHLMRLSGLVRVEDESGGRCNFARQKNDRVLYGTFVYPLHGCRSACVATHDADIDVNLIHHGRSV